MHTLFWILAFIGVALIYLVPYVGGKSGMSDKVSFAFKVFGVVLAVLSLLALYLSDGFR